MARNKMTDLRDHLFAQLERLSDEEINDEDLAKECKRSQSLTKIATVIVNSARVEMEYMKAIGADEITSPLFNDLNQKQLG